MAHPGCRRDAAVAWICSYVSPGSHDEAEFEVIPRTAGPQYSKSFRAPPKPAQPEHAGAEVRLRPGVGVAACWRRMSARTSLPDSNTHEPAGRAWLGHSIPSQGPRSGEAT